MPRNESGTHLKKKCATSDSLRLYTCLNNPEQWGREANLNV